MNGRHKQGIHAVLPLIGAAAEYVSQLRGWRKSTTAVVRMMAPFGMPSSNNKNTEHT